MPRSDVMPDRWYRWMIVFVAIVLWIDANVLLDWWLDDNGPENGRREPDAAVIAAYRDCRLNVGDVQLGYRLLEPAELVEGRRYPLVVYLHGAGEVGSDNHRQLLDLPSLMIKPEYRERFGCFVLAPQCPEGADWMTAVAALADGTTSEYATAALAPIEAVMTEQPIDPQRVYLTGFSMGGSGTWRLAAQRPELFAAIVPICGGGDPASAPGLVGVPVWAVHGGRDKVIAPRASQRIVDALRTAGGQPRLSIVAEAGHDTAWAYALDSGVLDWMYSQRRSD